MNRIARLRQALRQAENELRNFRRRNADNTNPVYVALNWISTSEDDVRRDIDRLGREEAAEYNLEMADEQVARGDDRWVGLTVEGLLEAFDELGM